MPIWPGRARDQPPGQHRSWPGCPTSVAQSPAASYIPHVDRTLSTWRTTGAAHHLLS
jgi:hypothetical protein